MKIPCIFLACICLCLQAGCAALLVNCSQSREKMQIRPATNPYLTLHVGEHASFETGDFSYGVLLPPGVYLLEAEDDDFWYFRAPNPLAIRHFRNCEVSSERKDFGGVMISKTGSWWNRYAGIYVDGKSLEDKIQIVELGRSFRRTKDVLWNASF
jgi:hypothetical protein